MIDVSPTITIPAAELTISFARSSGPGGQNVNKVNSKAVVAWNPMESRALPAAMRQRFRTTFASRLSEDGSLVVASDRFRHQARNLQDCFDKLREMVLKVLVPPKKRRPTRPTAASKERRIESKRRRSDTKKARKQDW